MKENSALKIVQKICHVVEIERKKILEIGCGSGRVTAFLAKKESEIIAIDPDGEEIEKARKEIKGIDFQKGSGEELVFSDESFDIVIFTLSLHHQNSNSAINEASRVLKKDGEIVVVEPDADGELERAFAIVHNEDQEKRIAQQAIKESNLRTVLSEKFTGQWVFNDEEDLCRSLLNYYNLPYSSEIKGKLVSLIGEKAGKYPIELQDLMDIKVLKKQ